jgi:protein-disulfide isomerase
VDIPPVGNDDHERGAEYPRLTLVEYGDFGCPFCFAAKRPIESLLERYDSLRLVWRHFPDPELHPGAELAAELSELASDQGSFWDAWDMLLAGREQITGEYLRSVADRLGLGDQAGVALEGRTYRDRVADQAAGGRAAGVTGTPTLFLDGERLVGHWRQLAQLVPERLGESG